MAKAGNAAAGRPVADLASPPADIRPVPPAQRRLSGFDIGILWADLSIGLLVMLTGALLVILGLDLPTALLAIGVGSVLGCIPLALVGLAGSREGVPGMVLFRPILGRRGSYLPSVLNIVQLVGWTGFEFWVMSLVADQMSERLLGFSSYWLWLGVVAVGCTALALGGPVLVVRAWLERFGAWVLAAVGAWITFRVLSSADLASLWSRPGTGGLSLVLAVDLVIALPVSWLPLVADYNRFARPGASATAGTFFGYLFGNVWFYGLGALLVLAAGLQDVSPAGVGDALAVLAGGWVVLLALLVGETDEAFADIYSAAVSSRNLSGRIPHRLAVVAVSVAGVGLATLLGLRPSVAFDAYEGFLFLLGSVFVPLFGVFVADYFVIRRWRPRPDRDGGGRGAAGGRTMTWPAVAWLAGFVIYQWSVPTGPSWWVGAVERAFSDWLHTPFPLAGSAAGASLPAFATAFLLHAAIARLRLRSASDSRVEWPSATPG
ncbi:putative hydroxymethylpyrimidine transporter CytX [soil metagenome]